MRTITALALGGPVAVAAVMVTDDDNIE